MRGIMQLVTPFLDRKGKTLTEIIIYRTNFQCKYPWLGIALITFGYMESDLTLGFLSQMEFGC